MMTVLRGGCHCGNLKVALETSLDPSVLQLRACQCSFCRRHGAVTTSDPAGRLLVEVGQPELLVRPCLLDCLPRLGLAWLGPRSRSRVVSLGYAPSH